MNRESKEKSAMTRQSIQKISYNSKKWELALHDNKQLVVKINKKITIHIHFND